MTSELHGHNLIATIFLLTITDDIMSCSFHCSNNYFKDKKCF